MHQFDKHPINQVFLTLIFWTFPLFVHKQRKPIFHCILGPSFYALGHLRPPLYAVKFQNILQQSDVFSDWPWPFFNCWIQVAIPVLSALFCRSENLLFRRILHVKSLGQFFPVFFTVLSKSTNNNFMSSVKISDYWVDHRKVSKLNFFRLSHLNIHFFHEVAGIIEEMAFQSVSLWVKRENTN